MADWYYEIDGRREGPFDELKIQRLIASGAIRPDTLVFHKGMSKPVKAIDSELYTNGIVPSAWYWPTGSIIFGLLSFDHTPLLHFSLFPMANMITCVFFSITGLTLGMISMRYIKKGNLPRHAYPLALTGVITSTVVVVLLITSFFLKF
ncbi:MAG: hypothetical protein A2017_10135 [Lentisphaerae bacterium GWF2_44_16]|nr:MAG: hypothetical protein A2017_10135 [Lentisphaerae bacterium GWF2_44_16]